jgi:hypothetical protein
VPRVAVPLRVKEPTDIVKAPTFKVHPVSTVTLPLTVHVVEAVIVVTVCSKESATLVKTVG